MNKSNFREGTVVKALSQIKTVWPEAKWGTKGEGVSEIVLRWYDPGQRKWMCINHTV